MIDVLVTPVHSKNVWLKAAATSVLLGVLLAVLTFQLQGSFWDANDYGLLSLADAVHLEWRLTHWTSIPSPGLADHPGILFYFASWLAVALSVPSFVPMDFERFSAIMANVDAIFTANQAIAIVIVALSVGAFIRVASRVAPFGIVLAALAVWLGSSYQSILTATSLSNETFALQLNVLFFWVLLRFTRNPKISTGDLIIAGLVAASGYLIKLPYLYAGFGLIAALVCRCVLDRTPPIRGLWNLAIIVATFVLFVAAIGYGVIGKQSFGDLLRFHEAVLLHSGHYGNGDVGILEISHAKAALHSLVAYGSAAPWVALTLGLLCLAGATGAVMGGAETRKDSCPELVIATGAGVAAVLAAVGVLKHFAEHYAAGVSATLPALVIACFLLLQNIRRERLRRIGLFLAAVLLASFLAYGLSNALYFAIQEKQAIALRGVEGLEDRSQLSAVLRASAGRAFFGYRVPTREFGEGFVLHFSGVEALKNEYHARNQSSVSSYMNPSGAFKYVVLDKKYFPNLQAVQKAESLNPASSTVIRLSSNDQIIELRRCFVVVKTQPFVLPTQ